MKKGFVHFLPVVAIALVLSAAAATIAVSKDLIPNASVLSSNSGSGNSGSNSDDNDKDDDSNSNSGSSSTGSSSSASAPSGSSSGRGGSDRTETVTTEGVRIKTETKDGQTKTEIKFPDESKIKTETKEDRTRTDVTVGGTKVRLERRDDRVVFKVEREGEEGGEELETDEILKIDQRLGGLKITTANNRFIVTRGQFQAQTDFPLSINLATNELIATTPAGEKVVTILPDIAVQNMIAAGIFDRIGTQPVIDQATTSAQVDLAGVITLAQQNGVPVFEILGLRNQRLLGFIPITTKIEAVVSAETGNVIETNQSFVDRALELLSI